MSTERISTTEVIHAEQQTIKEVMSLPSNEHITLYDTGWDSRVYHAKGYYFKFPRTLEARNRYKDEATALRLAAEIASPVIIPTLVYQGPENAYLGYEGVEGIPLEDIISQLEGPDKHCIGTDLGKFLNAFHALPPSAVRVVDAEQEIARFQGRYRQGTNWLRKLLSPHQQERIRVLAESAWPNAIRQLGRVPTLSHGDLHLGNIVYRPDYKQIGLIDFGDVGYHDQSKDLSDLDDQELTQAVLKTYGADDVLLQKITLRRNIANLIALLYFLGKEDDAEVQKLLPKVMACLD